MTSFETNVQVVCVLALYIKRVRLVTKFMYWQGAGARWANMYWQGAGARWAKSAMYLA